MLLNEYTAFCKQRASRSQSKPRRATRRKRQKSEPRVKANGAEPTELPRERARAALKANPDATLTAVAKATGVSHGTAINARNELAAEAREQARKRKSYEKSKATMPERRQRAERFLRDALAHGPQRVSDIEEQTEKAHVDLTALTQARGDLGVVTSRANAGGVRAVQWSLPG